MPIEITAILLLAGVLLLIRSRKLLPGLLRFLARSAGGYLFLSIFASIGPSFGLALGANLINSAVLGLLGIPGFGLLLMLRYMTF
ncbi:MAG: pro-sigmaK processing inhibitor BofA family protein [Oscillospiraceae bacterium]|nr:pro-sigmaK processing inhibitor BofA family protein [Oscillospiraceae bacterium]